MSDFKVINTTHYDTEDLISLIRLNVQERPAVTRDVVFGYEPRRALGQAAECLWGGAYRTYSDPFRMIVLVPPNDLGTVLPGAVVLGTVPNGRAPSDVATQIAECLNREQGITRLDGEKLSSPPAVVIKVHPSRPKGAASTWSRAKNIIRAYRKTVDLHSLVRKLSAIQSGVDKNRAVLSNYLDRLQARPEDLMEHPFELLTENK